MPSLDDKTREEIEEALAPVEAEKPDIKVTEETTPDFGDDYPWCTIYIDGSRCHRKAKRKVANVCLKCARRSEAWWCRYHIRNGRKHLIGHNPFRRPDACDGKLHILRIVGKR